MNIISNNCLGGFIYRDILKCEYQNPFIWTSIFPDTFNELLTNFERINFQNVKIVRDTIISDNNYLTILDNKYKIYNSHIFLSKKDVVPRNAYDKVHVDWINVYYNKPEEYILSKFKNRTLRMDSDIRVCMYDANDYGFTIEDIKKIIQTCSIKKYRALIFTEKKFEESLENIKIIQIKHVDPWIVNLYNNYMNEIMEFLK